jgi:hypothetical protein
MNMKGMHHSDRKDLPDFGASELHLLIDPGEIMRLSIDAHKAS